eukprot:5838353-Amphidinium_carterae.1
MDCLQSLGLLPIEPKCFQGQRYNAAEYYMQTKALSPLKRPTPLPTQPTEIVCAAMKMQIGYPVAMLNYFDLRIVEEFYTHHAGFRIKWSTIE